MTNAALPKTRRLARRFSACSAPSEGSGYHCNTSWRVFAQANGADGYCAQQRCFPTTGNFNRDGSRIADPMKPASCQIWNNERTAASSRACEGL